VKTVDRLDKYLKTKGIKPSLFEKTCHLSNGYFARQLTVKGSIGSDILEKIAEAYPDLNLVWLITGKTAMITKPPETTKEDRKANLLLEEEQVEYKKEVERLDTAKKMIDEVLRKKVKRGKKA